MSKENLHAQRQKRARNIVWTAAGRYDFRPAFLSFYADGEPDLYLNSIVGFVHRHYDGEKLEIESTVGEGTTMWVVFHEKNLTEQ